VLTGSEVLRSVTLLLLIGLAAVACNAEGEEACRRLDEFPARVTEATLGDVEELADAALDSATEEIREVGEQLTSLVEQRQALENLAPGASIDVLQTEIQVLRRACSDS
jgi:hypothetical protein